MNLTLITPPAAEPVSLTEARGHLKIDADMTAEDWLISLLISTARRFAEKYTSRSFINQTWQATLDCFPGYKLPGYALWQATAVRFDGYDIVIRNGPVKSITSVLYKDSGGNWQTLPDTDYIFDPSGLVQRISPASGKGWPVTIDEIACIRITYVAGYGPTTQDVPAEVRHWIMLRLSTLYENREEVAILGRGKVDPLPFVDSLIDHLKVPVI